MTTKTEALNIALKELETWQRFTHGENEHTNKAITAIKEALAKPEQRSVSEHLEPVGVVESASRFAGGFHVRLNRGATVPDVGSNIYTTPPQRKPLTDEEIYQMWTDEGLANSYDIYSLKEHVRRAARAIEAAHGIKE